MSKLLQIYALLFIAFWSNAQKSGEIGEYIKKANEKNKATIDKLNDLAREGDSVAFFKFRTECYSKAKQENDPYLLNYVHEKTGVWCYYSGNYKEGIPYFDSAIAICQKNGFEEMTASNYMNKGSMYFMLRNLSQAMSLFKASEAILTRINSDRLPLLLGNLALVYQEIGDLENSKKYLYKSIPFVKLRKDLDGYAKAINNLGLIHKKAGDIEKADSLFRVGYNYTKANSLHADFADVCYNLVNLLSHNGNYNEARTFNLELIEHVKKHKDRSWLKQVHQNMAQIYLALKDKEKAKSELEEAEKIVIKEEDMGPDDINGMLVAAEVYHGLGMMERSAEMYNKHHRLNEKVEAENDLMNTQQLSFHFDRQQDSIRNAKEKELAELANLHEQEKANNKLKQQKIIIIVSLIGILFVVVFLFFLIKANRNKEKANKEISYQRGLLAEKNKEITDSITYAQRIQHSLLPPLDVLEILLPKHFLVYLPKDIVSGDFFWAKKLNANEILLAVADCTGHGVPGAMMSALSIQNLNELSGQTRSPGELLSLLNTSLRHTLNQDQEGFSKDGLDICLCKINFKERKIVYAGANRSLQIFNNEGLRSEIKATKTGIGGHTPEGQQYPEQEVLIEKNDMVVMSTDGFADQFGGSEGKKITTKRFKEWIKDIVNSDDQKEELTRRFRLWKGNGDQIDDVCVLGFKI